jgi:hypothetical protein
MISSGRRRRRRRSTAGGCPGRSTPSRWWRRVAVERPAPGQRAVAEVPGDDHGAGVVAAGHDDARPRAVQVRGAGQEPVDPVAVAVAPRRHGAARRHVVGGRSIALPVWPLNTVRNSGPDRMYPTSCGSRRSRCRSPAGAVLGAVGGLHGDLGLAVAVVVEHLELGVVRAGPDVAAEVDAPQPGAVQLVRVDVDVAGVAGLRVVLGVGRIPLEHDLVLAVAVQVADARVVGAVGVATPSGVVPPGGIWIGTSWLAASVAVGAIGRRCSVSPPIDHRATV